MFDDDFAIDVISDFATGCYTVTRRKARTIHVGKAIPGEKTTIPIEASIQPAGGRVLQRLPEERRAIETRLIFTTEKLVVGGQGPGYEADLIEIDGVQWEVQNVSRWGSYTQALAQVPS